MKYQELDLQTVASRCQSYAGGEAVGEWRGVFNVESVDVLLKYPKEWQVESGQPRLLTLKYIQIHDSNIIHTSCTACSSHSIKLSKTYAQ